MSASEKSKLKTEFKKYGDDFHQLKRVGDVAMFQRTTPLGRVQYEIVKIQSHDGRVIGGNIIPPAEFYPSSATWGTYGWTKNTLTDAEEKFDALLQNQ